MGIEAALLAARVARATAAYVEAHREEFERWLAERER